MKMIGKIAFCIAAASAIAPAFAFAPAPQQDRNWQDNQHGEHDGDRNDHGNDHRDDHRDDRGGNYHDNGNHYGRGDWHPGPGGHWERGHRYDGRVVIVNDYRSRRLRAPPRGSHWVRADNGDLLLVAIATGVIADIVSQ